MQLIKRSKIIGTGEATPRGPQTIPNFSDPKPGSLMKTTSARQKAPAKLKRADRNVLDAEVQQSDTKRPLFSRKGCGRWVSNFGSQELVG